MVNNWLKYTKAAIEESLALSDRCSCSDQMDVIPRCLSRVLHAQKSSVRPDHEQGSDLYDIPNDPEFWASLPAGLIEVSIFCLPREEVYHGCERLTNEHEVDPEDAVSNDLASAILFGQRFRALDQG